MGCGSPAGHESPHTHMAQSLPGSKSYSFQEASKTREARGLRWVSAKALETENPMVKQNIVPIKAAINAGQSQFWDAPTWSGSALHPTYAPDWLLRNRQHLWIHPLARWAPGPSEKKFFVSPPQL